MKIKLYFYNIYLILEMLYKFHNNIKYNLY